MLQAYVNTKTRRSDGTYDNYLTVSVPVKESPMPWHNKGLTWTATGYGARIPSRYMINYNGRWRRVYIIQYSNIGTMYIGKKYDSCITVDIDRG